MRLAKSDTNPLVMGAHTVVGQSPDSSSYNETNGISFLQLCPDFRLIDLSNEVWLIKSDVKKFRIYIYLCQQVSQNFNLNIHTAKICQQVLQAAIADLCGTRKNHNN